LVYGVGFALADVHHDTPLQVGKQQEEIGAARQALEDLREVSKG